MLVITGSCLSSLAGWPGGTHTSRGGRVALWQVLTGDERRLAPGPAGRCPEEELLIVATTGLGELYNVVQVVGGPRPERGG
jgi:hypothetical protein